MANHEHQNQEPAASSYARALSLFSGLKAPAMRAAIRELRLPAGSRGLDLEGKSGQKTRFFRDATL